jgi:glycosyltransferase involved in cell wall biosynthesis
VTARPGETLVDVGIPTRGRPPYLAEAIECVLSQTLGSWRLTISENGAGSEEIASVVEPYLADGRVRHTVIGRDIGGAGNATGLLATGDARYVGILHDDDRWEPGFLERRVRFLDANPSCGLVFSPCDFIDSAGVRLYREDPELEEGLQDRLSFLRRLYRFNMICTPAVLAPRRCYEAVGAAFDESVLFYDHEMWLRLAARFDVGFLPACDAAYRVHRSQTSQEVRRRWGEHRLAVLARAESILPPDFPPLDRRRVRWEASVRALVDSIGRRDPRAAAMYLRRAVGEHPLAPVDPRIASRALRWVLRRGLRRRVRRAALSE